MGAIEGLSAFGADVGGECGEGVAAAEAEIVLGSEAFLGEGP